MPYNYGAKRSLIASVSGWVPFFLILCFWLFPPRSTTGIIFFLQIYQKSFQQTAQGEGKCAGQ